MKILKKLALCLISIVILTACSTDENINAETESADLIGSWNVTSSKLNSNTVTSYNKITFTSNNRATFLYKGAGNNGQDITDTCSWTIKGDVLTITWDSADAGLEVYKLNVIEFTATKLKWSTVISGEGTLIEELAKT
ncbi:lipocalin family protein [Flavobacterium sp. ZT3R17]|uniref:lipocalin family protein n=1 Tax=Flavobacterium cryoconiti TaxID=3398736 RepID=UPI003A88EC57